ncbi:hypothetical protein GOV12_03840 [Candidatus Pacearchaeota archaeon]|nr:hypothetical protein [Candidatus Pacearchaeota archaeon]
MKRVLILYCVILILFTINFVSALTINLESPTDGQVFTSADSDILVKATVESDSTCDVWGFINTPNGKKIFSPRDCDICSKGGSPNTIPYAKSITANIDAIPGGDYELHVVCRDRNNQMDIKIINFNVVGDISTDTTLPVITLNHPQEGGNHYSNINMEFVVNELSHCKYSNSPKDYNGGSGTGFSDYINKMTYEKSFKHSTDYSFTVTCTDLMDNTASKTVSFKTLDKACETCSSQTSQNSTPTSGGSSGGGIGGGCFDTDSGKNIFIKGIASGVYDSCISTTQINERYCTDDNTGADVIKNCPSGYICNNGACIVSDDVPTTNSTQVNQTSITYYKNCKYIWDSTPYIGQTVIISTSIQDLTGTTASDSVEVKVLESVQISSTGAHSMYPKTLNIQITQPSSSQVAGPVEIYVNSIGPNELEEISIGISGENSGSAFPISNRNCVYGRSSNGGGSNTSVSTCEKYHICNDGSEVQYCEAITHYDDNGNVMGGACGCKENPEELCTSSSASGGGSNSSTGGSGPSIIPTPTSGGGGRNETPFICTGCILGNNCVQVGYRTEDMYCNINSELINQLQADSQCNNNFECNTNLCIDSKCISSGLWQRFVKWIENIFG